MTQSLAQKIRETWKDRLPIRSEMMQYVKKTPKEMAKNPEGYKHRIKLPYISAPDPNNFRLPLGISLPADLTELLVDDRQMSLAYDDQNSTDIPFWDSGEHHGKKDSFLVDGKTLKKGNLEILYKKYDYQFLTLEGKDMFSDIFGDQLPKEDIDMIHHDLNKLIENPDILDSIDLMLGLWNHYQCGHLFWLSGLKPGKQVTAASSVIQTLEKIASESGLKIPASYSKEIDFEHIKERFELYWAFKEVSNHCERYEDNGQYKTRIPAITADKAINHPHGKEHLYDELISAARFQIDFKGGKTHTYELPVKVKQLRALVEDFPSRGLKNEQVDTAKSSIGITRNLLGALARYNFLEISGNEQVLDIDHAIDKRIGFFDYISTLASKAIYRLKSDKHIDICFPIQKQSGTKELPIGIMAKNLVQPFKPQGVEIEIPNDTYFGNTVNIVAGSNSGGKTYFWNQTIIPARIAAGIGDCVFASEFKYDPRGRIIIPYLPDKVDKSQGGFSATADAFKDGLMKHPLYRGDIIIQDESGGTTSEEVEAHMIFPILTKLADQGIGAYYITHNRGLMDRTDKSNNGIGVISCGLKETSKELVPTHKFVSGKPDWDLYFRYAAHIIGKSGLDSSDIIIVNE